LDVGRWVLKFRILCRGSKDADDKLRAKAEAWWQEKGYELARAGGEQFRKETPHGKDVEFDDADHYLFEGKNRG
jgi:hypothetical protein